MKRKPTANPSSLFLLELIFAILFFSVASAVCVQIFVKSNTLSTQAHDLTQASRRAGDVAELITASTSPDDMKNLLEDAYSDAVNIASENFTIFYDSDFIPCSPELRQMFFISCLSDIICKGGTDHETEEKNIFFFYPYGCTFSADDLPGALPVYLCTAFTIQREK